MKKKSGVGSTHFLVISRLGIAFVMLLVARSIFIVFNRGLLGQPLSFSDGLMLMLKGLRFDFSALMMLNGLWIALATVPFPFRNKPLYRWLIGWLFFIPNIAAILVNLGDVAYFPFTLRRSTGDLFNYLFANEGMSLALIPGFMADFWMLFAAGAIMIWVFVAASIRIRVDRKLTFHQRGAYFIWNLPVYLLWIALVVIGIRGGFQLKPISLVNAAPLVEAPKISAVLNTPFVMIKTYKAERLAAHNYMTDEEATLRFNPDKQLPADTVFGRLKGYNVMIIILESFSLEHTAAGGSKSFTPFLDSLSKEGLFFKAIANGKRSIEAIPAIVASLPTWMGYDFISSPFASNKINSLASLLGQSGYSSLFLHGGKNGTMNFDAFSRLAGFDRYYGRKEYNNDNDFDGNWGIWDEPFLAYAADVLSHTRQPFIATLFTLSSHHPYKVPGKYSGKFPKGSLPIQQAVAYSDYSLMKFFEKASHTSWYKKTLFVLTADHTSESAGGYYATRAGQYAVPLLFFSPDGLPRAGDLSLVQQTDIMPTVLHLTGFGERFTAFGSSLYDTLAPRFAMNYADDSYQFFFEHRVIHYSDNKITACYNLATDSLQARNLKDSPDETARCGEPLLKAILQQYNHRMNNNLLTPSGR